MLQEEAGFLIPKGNRNQVVSGPIFRPINCQFLQKILGEEWVGRQQCSSLVICQGLVVVQFRAFPYLRPCNLTQFQVNFLAKGGLIIVHELSHSMFHQGNFLACQTGSGLHDVAMGMESGLDKALTIRTCTQCTVVTVSNCVLLAKGRTVHNLT